MQVQAWIGKKLLRQDATCVVEQVLKIAVQRRKPPLKGAHSHSLVSSQVLDVSLTLANQLQQSLMQAMQVFIQQRQLSQLLLCLSVNTPQRFPLWIPACAGMTTDSELP